ncbi:hypothetical protein CAPTEDRAFT_226378 [Capitella teleta]|uniref:Uncharacterized protein n=1 Tax=Capitella teleta TaxID=283909 RepID=R7UKT9_CAPTE|nr:hypothetical protein CAPTEDRAFT_226378 [Capitella teleta]|eukprot:ELU06713.1 hypothetical protein CAPTEDRAFT_226378 [Capitella teleta]
MEFEKPLIFTEDICESGLESYSYAHPKKDEILSILKYSFNEIKEGVITDSSLEERQKSTIEALSIMMYQLLQQLNTKNETVVLPSEAGYEAVVFDLPTVNVELFFDLISAVDLNSEFIQVLIAIDQETGSIVLREYASSLENKSWDCNTVHQLLYILEYLSLVYNPHLEASLLLDILPFMSTPKFRRLCKENASFQARLMVCWVPLYHLILMETIPSISLTCLNAHHTFDVAYLPNNVVYCGFECDRDLVFDEMVMKRDEEVIERLKTFASSISLLDQTSVRAYFVEEDISDDFESLMFLFAPRVLVLWLQQILLLHGYRGIMSDGATKDCEILLHLEDTIAVIESYRVAKVIEERRPGVVFEKAIHVIENRITKGSELEKMSKWICACDDTDVILDPRFVAIEFRFDSFFTFLYRDRWTETIMINAICIASKQTFDLLFLKLVKWKRIGRDDLFVATRLALLEIFNYLDFDTQNQLVIQVYHEPEFYDMLEPLDMECYREELKLTFNQLVAIDISQGISDGVRNSLGSISFLALQSPSKVINSLILLAVQNKGQIPIVLLVLSNIRCLCRVEAPNGKSVLIAELRNTLCQVTKQLPFERNTEHFCRALLMSNNGSLIDRGEFVQEALTPLMSGKITFGFRIAQAITLLDTVVDLVPSSNICLSNNLGMGDEFNCNVYIKQLSISIIKKIITKMFPHRQEIPVTAMHWLSAQIEDIAYPVLLYLDPLWPRTSIRNVPAIMNSRQEGYTSYPFELNDLLLLARAGPQGLTLAMDALDLSKVITTKNAHMLMLALLQVLPVSITDEWICIATFLQRLFNTKKFNLAECIFPRISKRCFVSHLFFCALKCLRESRDSPEPSSQWVHMAKAYAATVKAVFIQSPTDRYLLVLIAEVVLLLNILPEKCSDTIQVLILDLISRVDHKTDDSIRVFNHVVFSIQNPEFQALVRNTVFKEN